MRTRITLTIAAPIGRVWRALTDPEVVTGWAAVEPVVLPAGYPTAGQRAIWRDRSVLLIDDIVAVEPERLMVSRLAMGPWRVNETYALQPRGARSTILSAAWRGHPALAINDVAMRRLKAWCETYC